MAAAAGGGVLLLVVIIAIAMSSGDGGGGAASKPSQGRKPPAGTTSPTATPTEDPAVAERRRREEEERRRKAAEDTCESLFNTAQQHANARNWEMAQSAIAELLAGSTGTLFYADNRGSIDRLAEQIRLKKGEDPVESEAPVASSAKDLNKLRNAYDAKARGRATEGRRRYDEAVKAAAARRSAEEAEIAEQLKRVGGKKLAVALKSGLLLDNVVVKSLSAGGVRLAYHFEGAEVESEFGWDLIDDASYVALLKAIYTADGAKGLYEIGRRCVARKLWKEAKAAFDSCVKKDEGFKERVPDLSGLLANQGAFKGVTKRAGRDRLVISYNFSDAEQAADFTAQGEGELEVEGGAASFTARELAFWTIRDLEFEGEVAVDARVSIEGESTLIIGAMFGADATGYFLGISKGGTALFRLDGSLPDKPIQAKEGGVAGTFDLRFGIRDGKFLVSANGTEIFSGSDATYRKGALFLGAGEGTIVLRKLVVEGKMNPAELDKRFAEAEMLARRATEDDLSAKDDDGEIDDSPLTVEDDYFLAQLSDEMRDEFEDGRKMVVRMARYGYVGEREREGIESLGKVIARHPDFPAARYWRGRAARMLGRAKEAREDLVEAAKHPDFAEARAELGELFLYEYRFDKARRYADEALRMAPDHAAALSLRGYLKFHAKDVKGAMADFEVAARLAPEDPEIRQRQRQIANVVKGPEYLGCKHRKDTAHYVVLTDISMERTRFYGEHLEAAWKHFAETFKAFFKDEVPKFKPRIAIFNTREAFYTYSELTSSERDEGMLGYFTLLNNELLLFEEVDTQATLETLYHEAFHQFMSLMCPRAPYWYNEGIAEYMSAIRIEKGKVVEKGRLHLGRLRELKGDMELFHPFETIMKQSPGQFYSGPKSFKYAQAWSMVHFFYEYDKGRHRHLIDAYYKALLEDKDIDEAYQAAFGRADMDALQKDWRRFIDRLSTK